MAKGISPNIHWLVFHTAVVLCLFLAVHRLSTVLFLLSVGETWLNVYNLGGGQKALQTHVLLAVPVKDPLAVGN